jgi:1,4-alpha-glucan branching enzyme
MMKRQKKIRKNIRNKRKPLLSDPWLKPYADHIKHRKRNVESMEKRLTGGMVTLLDFASGHEYYGLHYKGERWIFREWAPNASAIFLVGDFSNWKELPEYRLNKTNDKGDWEVELSEDKIRHGQHYRLRVYWDGGGGDRIPAYARYVVQDAQTLVFSAQVWKPEKTFKFRFKPPISDEPLLVYETHVGMAAEEEKIGSFLEFKDNILPKIVNAGYNTIQIMAILSHPYYGSFGYHVANFFSVSSRFGTPDDFKALVDEAHRLGLRVIIDMVHSHAVKNEIEGIARFDGTFYQYFHEGERGRHRAWDSLCFNYDKPEVLHFLLSNCRFWIDEYKVDGFRFDGVTSMLYKHHGLNYTFTGYDDYFNDQVDEEAYVYLALANKLIHRVRKSAVTIAEDVSGMPGLAAPLDEGGCGFDYRLAMGVTDYWFKLFDIPDEQWPMNTLWHELTNRRLDEQAISYLECHDQAIVGGQTAIFRMIGEAMYYSMALNSGNIAVERGVALHKMARLATISTAANGYLNFMGNEYGHPEWVDFPREGNNWSYKYARRQWSLAERKDLYYYYLNRFDQEMVRLIKENRIYDAYPKKLYINDTDKIMIFERNGLYFFFNFNAHISFTDYTVEVLPGTYTLVLNSDSQKFAGHNRIDENVIYSAIPQREAAVVRNMIKLYLPTRTALVLKRE